MYVVCEATVTGSVNVTKTTKIPINVRGTQKQQTIKYADDLESDPSMTRNGLQDLRNSERSDLGSRESGI
jgi:hypothetical protein